VARILGGSTDPEINKGCLKILIELNRNRRERLEAIVELILLDMKRRVNSIGVYMRIFSHLDYKRLDGEI
jgi:hypothetical protein